MYSRKKAHCGLKVICRSQKCWSASNNSLIFRRIYPVFHKTKSLHSWPRGPNAPILWSPPILPPPPSFSNFVQTPPLPCHLQPPPPMLFLSLNGWSHHIWCVILLNIMDLHMSSLGTLVPKEPWRVFYAKRVYWGLTHHVVLCRYSDLISNTHKHTQTNTHNIFRGQ